MFGIARKKELVIFDPVPEGDRFIRFPEEAKKIGLSVRVFNPYHVTVTNQGIFDKNKKIEFNKNSVVWLVGNSKANHNIIYLLNENKVKNIWPNLDSLVLSNKFYANSFFYNNDIPTPKTVLINYPTKERIREMVKTIGGFPAILKKSEGSTGAYVRLVNSADEALQTMKEFFHKEMIMPFRVSSYILQEFIGESAGEDFRVIVLNGKVLGGIKRKSIDGDFRANVSLGGEAEIIEVDKEMKEMALKIAKEGKLFYAGIDFIKSDRGYLALEINTSSQFKGFEEATGINVAGKIMTALLKK
jgi:ribosomal protein S6--L-glutamate ligase